MFIIGDVHGYFETLLRLIDKLPKDEPLCFVGDLIDRGPQSPEVVEYVRKNGHHCVKGNHEDMGIRASKGFSNHRLWTGNGGFITRESYQQKDTNNMKEDFAWMAQLPLFLEFPELKRDSRHLVVTHSNLGQFWDRKDKTPFSPFSEQVLWGRGEPIDYPDLYNVCGHTPQRDKPDIREYYACIDRGVYGPNEGYGHLCALHFPTLEYIEVPALKE